MILELRQDLLCQLLLKVKANRARDQTQRRYKMKNEITNFLSTGTRIQRGDNIIHERNVKLPREIQYGL
jgi:hypothetical protein